MSLLRGTHFQSTIQWIGRIHDDPESHPPSDIFYKTSIKINDLSSSKKPVGIKIVTGLLTLALLMAAFVPGLSAQTVEAFVDRDTIHFGETVKFTIKWSGPNQGTSVNLEVLEKDFKVLGSTQSNQIIMFEGQTKITTELITKLKPKHAGKLEIPAFQVGPHQTSSITLNVLPGPQPGQPGDNGDRPL